jgi:glutamate-1-semialdehyde 2,1-aminomutase
VTQVQASARCWAAYHPCVLDNVARLRRSPGLDEVSFHMSGTEAVMQAVRLARYHTRRSHLVRFCGAYHGWWEDVQPGPGNPLPPRETYTLREMDERSLQVLRTRRDIACVLVNPLQALAPQLQRAGRLLAGRQRARRRLRPRGLHALAAAAAPGVQRARHRADPRRGLRRLPAGPGGAQEYFGVRADMVTYGKTLGGGLPVGVVCGRRDLMKRWREQRPADICFARGTFNSHPYVMAAMKAFLDRSSAPR